MSVIQSFLAGQAGGAAARDRQLEQQRLSLAGELAPAAFSGNMTPEQAQELSKLDPASALQFMGINKNAISERIGAGEEGQKRFYGTAKAYQNMLANKVSPEQLGGEIMKNIQSIQSRGGQPTQQVELLQTLQSGDTKKVADMINNAVSIGESYGYIDKPKQEKKQVGMFKTERVGDKMMIINSGTGEVAKEFVIPESKEDKLKLRKLLAETNKAETESELKLKTAQSEVEKEEAATGFLQDTLNAVRELKTDENLGQAIGSNFFVEYTPNLRAETSNIVNKAKRVEALLTKDNLALMSGTLTDKDIELLKRVGSGLDVRDGGIVGTEEEVNRILTEIEDRISQKLNPTTPLTNNGDNTFKTKSGISFRRVQ